MALALRVIHGMQDPVGPRLAHENVEPEMSEIVYGPYADFTAARIEGALAAMNPAPALIQAPPVARPLVVRAIRVGNRDLHWSHTIMHERGMYWCQRCGCFGATRARRLAEECRTVPTREGRYVLNRLHKGLPPKSGIDWPLVVSPLSGLVRPYTDGPYAAPIEPLRDG